MERRISDPVRLFDGIRNKLNSQSQSSFGGNFANPNLLKLKRESTYKLRILWINAAEGFNREVPMINQYVHRIWDDNAIGSRDVKVYCRTSQYDKGETREGYETCPICKKMSAVYKEYSETGSKSCQEIYSKFRRTLHGYVPVYVVSGPAEDAHKIKILQYTKMFKDFFDAKIFGVTKRKPNQNGEQVEVNDAEDMIGMEAFTYYDTKSKEIVTKGYDFIVSVGTKRIQMNGKMIDVPDYKLDFARKMTDVDFEDEEMSVDRFLNLSDELGFDRDFYKISTDEQLEEFKAKYISNDSVINEEVDDLEVEEEKPKASKMNQIMKDIKTSVENAEIEDEEVEEPKRAPKTTPKAAPKHAIVVEEVEEEPAPAASNDEDDLNIDDLLKDL